MRFNCPECGCAVLVANEESRPRVTCPRCQEIILVPRPLRLPSDSAGRRDDLRLPGAQLLRGRIYRWYSGLARVRWGKL